MQHSCDMLRRHRQARGLNQMKLAMIICIPLTHLMNFENGMIISDKSLGKIETYIEANL